ncbi:MAG: eCIS core domain-containing protein [Acidimicrobiales bacterium]
MRGDARTREQPLAGGERGTGRQRSTETDQATTAHVTAHAAAALSAGGPVSPSALPLLQRAAGNAAVASAMEELDGSSVHGVVSGGGAPLDQPVQTAMEAQLGVDLSDVRVHTDSRASQSAESINAQAYTAGSHIVFQRQQYQPGTDSGLQMLAHELTHVVQQRSGPVDGTPVHGGVSVSDPSDRFERAAEQNASTVVQAIGGVAGLDREEEPEDLL